ncbi:MAG: Maf family protein, partial [Aminobacteriaceae bacterium]
YGRETGVEATDVSFRTLGEDEIRAYAESGECDDKAGAYAIQGLGALLVEGIRGDYFNVVGLPLYRLSRMFGSLGFSLSDQWRLKR